MFVVSFFINLAFWKFLSAKVLNSPCLFWYILPVCNQFDIFSFFNDIKNIYPVQKSGLAFFLLCPYNEKNARFNASFFAIIFLVSCFYFYVYCVSL